jgi:hypothetical protein
VEGSCKHGNEPSGSIEYREILCVAEQLAASHVGVSAVELLCLIREVGSVLQLYQPKHEKKSHDYEGQVLKRVNSSKTESESGLLYDWRFTTN